MAFFNHEREEENAQHQGHRANDHTKLTLMRSFETRLWELDVQVQDIKCIGFGPAGVPSQMSNTVLRCSQVGVAVVRRGPEGHCPLSLWPQTRPLLLAEGVGAEHFELILEKVVEGREVRETIFPSTVEIQDLDTLVAFMLSYHQWCG
ncbi:unnamed protein product [Pylaiella littoralis]